MTVESLIQSLGETEFYCLPNEGNAGDGLIHAGLNQLAARLGLKLDFFRYPEERRGKNLLLVGAGCFCRGSWHMVDPVRYYSGLFEKVYVLPATFETEFAPVKKMLRELPANVTLFCREQVSYEAVTKLVPTPGRVFLDHDLAFQVDVTPWKRKGEGHLNAFRTDNESLLRRVPAPNFDISNMGREYHHTLLFDALANFESVSTDRLHVAIAGALLGKKVRLFDGNYHKIRAIYEYSIRDGFPNVTMGNIEELRQLLAASDRATCRHWLHRLALRIPQAAYLRRILKQRLLKQQGK
jgi:hypothetical protein